MNTNIIFANSRLCEKKISDKVGDKKAIKTSVKFLSASQRKGR
jgi:hypothetical protein